MNRNRMIKLAFICFFTLGGLLFLTKDSFASNSPIVGFMIEANQMEGTIKSLSIVTGDTNEQKDQPMLEFNFENLSANGLIIKKMMNTPKGITTINMSSKETALFNNLKVKATNVEFSGLYKPSNGNIGFKKIKILAHQVTADNNSLPQFQFDIDDQSKTQMTPKSKEDLMQIKALLESLLPQ